MKPRGNPQPEEPDSNAVGVIIGLYFAYEEGVERCQEVAGAERPIGDDLQRRALATACTIAYVNRVIWNSMLNRDLLGRLSPEMNPMRALAASARLAYSLTAAAEPDPEPETILTVGDLDGLPVQYELRDWLEYMQQFIGPYRERWLNVLSGVVVGAKDQR